MIDGVWPGSYRITFICPERNVLAIAITEKVRRIIYVQDTDTFHVGQWVSINTE